MKPKAYIETSVVSYLTATRPSRDLIIAANQKVTADWWQTRKDMFEIFISSLVEQKASQGNPEAAKKILDAIKGISLLVLSPEIREFLKKLILKKSLPHKVAEDALHIAIATLNGKEIH